MDFVTARGILVINKVSLVYNVYNIFSKSRLIIKFSVSHRLIAFLYFDLDYFTPGKHKPGAILNVFQEDE